MQISPGKNANCRCTSAAFTVGCVPVGFAVMCQLASHPSALYAVSVRQADGLKAAAYLKREALCKGMIGHEYEQVVAALVQRITQNTPLQTCTVGAGRRNRIRGASSYPHQIDVSLLGDQHLYLIEAKYWARPVGVGAVLMLASRLSDIRNAFTSVEVHASVVSTKHTTRGMKALAEHLGINVEIVHSPEEYALRFGNQHFIGVNESVYVQDASNAELLRICTRCGERFQVVENECVCPACAGSA